jgi:hypothetical protein
MFVGRIAAAESLLYRIEGRVTEATDTMTRAKLEFARGLKRIRSGSAR